MAVVVLDNSTAEPKELSQLLKLPLIVEPVGYYLIKSQGQWVVRDSRQSKNFQLSVDLHKDFEQIQRQKINPKKDLFWITSLK